MPEITRQRQGEMVRKVFEILLAHPDGLPAKQVLATAAAELTLSPFEESDYPNHPGVRRFEKILRFSTIPFVKAGWMLKTKGNWIVTDEGKSRVRDSHRPGRFHESCRRALPEVAED